MREGNVCALVQDAYHEGPRVRWARGFRSHLIHPGQRVLDRLVALALESRGSFGKSKHGFRAQPPMPDAIHLTLLLCFIEAIEVAFPRHAPWIFLSVSGLRGQTSRNNHIQCDSRKR